MDFIKYLPEVRGQYRLNAGLSKFCWFKVGGIATVLFKPTDVEDLQSFIIKLDPEIPYFILGAGSNVLVKDSGFNGVVIRLGQQFNFINNNGYELSVGAATLDFDIAKYALNQSIAGLEFFSGIPGTFGGALAMNAGAYGGETKDVLVSLRALNTKGEIKTFCNKDINFTYRNNPLSSDWIFLDGVIKGHLGQKSQIQQRIDDIKIQREKTQPVTYKTCGSTFKNIKGISVWKLIDEAGCRGFKIGGAMVSELHCNFFVNLGNATASDLINLIYEVKNKVLAKTGVLLEEEVKIIG